MKERTNKRTNKRIDTGSKNKYINKSNEIKMISNSVNYNIMQVSSTIPNLN